MKYLIFHVSDLERYALMHAISVMFLEYWGEKLVFVSLFWMGSFLTVCMLPNAVNI